MQKRVFIIFLFTVVASLLASEPPRSNTQVAAALSDAFDKLDRQVLSTRVTSSITVQELMDRVGGQGELTKTIHAAQSMGGPRWLDEQTVQVRVMIDGGRIARTILHVVRKNPSKSPIPPGALERDLRGWRERSFAATGLSSGSAEIAQLQAPPANRAWAGVSDQARRDALSVARDQAAEHLLDSLRPIQLAPDRTLDQALSVPEVNDAVRGWLSARPVKSVEFGDDLSVRLTLSTPPDELWQVLRSALSRQKQVPVPTNQAGWDWLEGQVTARMAPAVGVGTAQSPIAVPAGPSAILPMQAPEWSTRYLDAEATSAAIPGGNQLKTARAAESMAMEILRKKVDALPLDPKTSLGQAEHQDPRIAQAVFRAMKHARPYQVEYKDRGTVTVHVSINLGDLWAQIAGG